MAQVTILVGDRIHHAEFIEKKVLEGRGKEEQERYRDRQTERERDREREGRE